MFWEMGGEGGLMGHSNILLTPGPVMLTITEKWPQVFIFSWIPPICRLTLQRFPTLCVTRFGQWGVSK